jgi:uncharacterized protein YndB with AHSA1/START domain
MKRMELTVTRTIQATPAEVYDVWLDAKSPGGPWFGAQRVILQSAVDGLFYHCVRHEGRDWAHYGRFVRLERPRVIEHTWMSEATRGIESIVTVMLEPAAGGGTHLTLRHVDLPDDDMGRQHEEGWTFIVGAIEQKFARRASA